MCFPRWNFVLLSVPAARAGDDFYEQTMRMVLVGFQRFERKFGSLPELVATINKVGQLLPLSSRST